MPSDKRQRQREGRQQRQEQLQAQRRKNSRQRTVFTMVIIVVGGFVLLTLLNRGGGDNNVPDEPVINRPPVTDAANAPECPAADGSSPKTDTFPAPPKMCIDPNKTYTAEMVTSKGTMTIELDAKKAPRTVNNFVFLSRYHYYDGVGFHRIIPGFVVQGGDPQGTGSGGPGYKFGDELPKAGEYQLGSLAMANSGKDTNGSQFFIITGDQGVSLPPNYSLFGKVTAGMDVAKALEAVGSASGTPSEPVKMEKVTITES